jgi:hypothetical protein
LVKLGRLNETVGEEPVSHHASRSSSSRFFLYGYVVFYRCQGTFNRGYHEDLALLARWSAQVLCLCFNGDIIHNIGINRLHHRSIALHRLVGHEASPNVGGHLSAHTSTIERIQKTSL